MHNGAEELYFGCLFCKSGSERAIITYLEKENAEVELLSPQKYRYWRNKQETRKETVPLFPGYIFFRAPEDYDVLALTQHNDIFKLLRSGTDWRLFGADCDMIAKIFAAGGTIDFSDAYFEGGRIRITSGFLKEYEGKIMRVNRRAETAQISITLHDKTIQMWVGYREIKSV